MAGNLGSAPCTDTVVLFIARRRLTGPGTDRNLCRGLFPFVVARSDDALALGSPRNTLRTVALLRGSGIYSKCAEGYARLGASRLLRAPPRQHKSVLIERPSCSGAFRAEAYSLQYTAVGGIQSGPL